MNRLYRCIHDGILPKEIFDSSPTIPDILKSKYRKVRKWVYGVSKGSCSAIASYCSKFPVASRADRTCFCLHFLNIYHWKKYFEQIEYFLLETISFLWTFFILLQLCKRKGNVERIRIFENIKKKSIHKNAVIHVPFLY